MTLLLFASDRLGGHEPPPGHPERPERSDVMHVVAGRWRERGVEVREPHRATRAQVTRVHDESYLDHLAATSGRAVVLDPDTFTSPESYDVALLAAGASIGAVDAVLDGAADRAAALIRPPGHHAGRSQARGFCILNNAAIAAAHALARGVRRVAVVDFDVHHGNGTQEIFEHDPRVLYVSVHQYPFYPGGGWLTEVGTGDGEGYTVNVPLDAGATDADYDLVFRAIVQPVVSQFDPGLLVVSAGYDAHARDPLGGMRATESGFARMAEHLAAASDQCCGGRMVLTTEGGYELKALAASLDATLQVLSGQGGHPGQDALAPDAPAPGTPARAAAALAQLRPVQGRYWRGL